MKTIKNIRHEQGSIFNQVSYKNAGDRGGETCNHEIKLLTELAVLAVLAAPP